MHYYNDDSFLSKLERKIGRFAIKNWIYVLIAAMAMVWVADFVLIRYERSTLSSFMDFDRDLVLKGQVWRVITFIFMPEDDSPLFVILSLYFYWFIGTTVENEWGAFRFNVYYLTGYLGALASGFIMGKTTNYYLNLTIFLAYAILNAEHYLYLFFLIRIKVKWLAIFEFALLTLVFVLSSWVNRVALIFSLANVMLFFGKDLLGMVRSYFRRRKYKKQINNVYYEVDVNPPKEKKKKQKKDKDTPSDNSSDDFFN